MILTPKVGPTVAQLYGWGLSLQTKEWLQGLDDCLNLLLLGLQRVELRNNVAKFCGRFVQCESVRFLSHSQPLVALCSTSVLLNKL